MQVCYTWPGDGQVRHMQQMPTRVLKELVRADDGRSNGDKIKLYRRLMSEANCPINLVVSSMQSMPCPHVLHKSLICITMPGLLRAVRLRCMGCSCTGVWICHPTLPI